MGASVLDTALDLSVVGGYTSIGYRIRRHSWSDSDLHRLDGKVVLVTGGSSGVGFAAADWLARLGAVVWLAVRNAERGEMARTRIAQQAGSPEVHVGVCDLSSLRSIRRFASEFAAASPRLDVLINNAGVLTPERGLSVDGVELTLATNVIGPFLLTSLLSETMEQSAPSRIVNVSSGGMYAQRLRVEDLQSERGSFDGAEVYARTKRAEVILTEMWADRLAGRGVVVHSMHPGWVDTPGLRSSLPRFHRLTRPLLRTPAQGADTIVWLASSDQALTSTGGFWHDRRRRPTHLLPRTRETPREREQLWAQCASLSGRSSDLPPDPSHQQRRRHGPIQSDS